MAESKRIIELTSPEILELVEKKVELVKEGRVLNEEAIELADKHSKLVEQIEEKSAAIREIQLEVIPLVADLCKEEDLLTEYEVPLTTDIKDDGLILEVEDQMEVFKSKFEGIDKFQVVPAVKEAVEEIKE